MSKIICLALLLSPLLVAGCGDSATTSAPTKDGQKAAAKRSIKEPTIDDLVRHFKKKGLNVTKIEKGETTATGASRGWELTINDKRIMVVWYDLADSSQEKMMIDIQKNGYLTWLGSKFTAKVNSPFMMFHYPEHPDSSAIVKAFDSF